MLLLKLILDADQGVKV